MSKHVDKRVRYFDGQTLKAKDYIDEQTYHINRRRSHNQWLHCAGVCVGLNVSLNKKNGLLILRVSPGTALDLQGRLIVLSKTHTEDLNKAAGPLKVFISYNEEQSDTAGDGDNKGHNMRWHERARIEIGAKIPAGDDPILLATVDLAAGKVDNTVRRYAGLRLPGAGKPENQATLYSVVQGFAEFSGNLIISSDLKVTQDLHVGGKVGIGIPKPSAALDVNGTVNATKFTGDGSQLTVNQKLSVQNALDKKLDKSGGNITGPLTIESNVVIGTSSPSAKLDVNGVVRADTFESTNPLRHRMYPEGPIVFQEIFKARDSQAIQKWNKPFYDDTTYKSRWWFDCHLIRYGSDHEKDGNGALVTIPPVYDTVWVRVLGERWTVIKADFNDGKQENLGLWAGGYRSGNCYCPDGSLSDSYYNMHQWLPIPAGRSGKLVLVVKPYTNNHFWLSGLAFSNNPWSHAVQSAVGYHWALNGGDKLHWAGGWENWNSDSLTKINPKTNWLLKVPVLPSGRDKLLYLVEHNNSWNGCMHNGITVNNKSIERFFATYDNPFARHWNSKFYNRYIAARIPAKLIPDDARHLDVRINMSKQNQGIHFREAGTHDLNIPWNRR